ncbi:hypothetical protein ACOACO_17965 [Nocardioides sp. CPCC 205120]|uniref:hypothetical protein n=1 Tax=Nocardioides sp. CPCC 205120 TaxID=3406462 RepID=UPI003B512585
MRVVAPGTPTGDLFWDLVRRRHPTMDVVLRPRAAGPAGPAGPADPAEGQQADRPEAGADLLDAAAVAEERERTALDVPRLLEAAGLGVLLPDEPALRLLAGGRADAVRWHARVARTVPAGEAASAAERLEELLAGRGSQVRRTEGSALVVLHADGAAGRCRASYAPGTQLWVLERWSPPLRVGAEQARALRREAARALP